MNRRARFSIVWFALLFALGTQAAHAQPVPQAAFDLVAALAAAKSGDVVTVPPGVYAGPLVIDRPVILQGEGMPVITGNGRGTVITVEAPDVTIRGFVIRASGNSLDREDSGVVGLAPRLTLEDNLLENTLFGVNLQRAGHSIVRNNEIHSQALPLARRGDGIRVWYSDSVRLENNIVRNSRDVVIWFSAHGTIRQNTVEGSRYGLHFMFSNDQSVEQNILRNNSVGLYQMYGRDLLIRGNLFYNNRGPSGYGIGLKDTDDIVAEENYIVGNRLGVYIDYSPREPASTVLFERNLFAYNETGLTLQPSVKRNTYVENVFHENGEHVVIAGSGTLRDNEWARDGQGNYWSDYAGFDSAGDGIGDLPYISVSLYEDLLQTHPELRLFRLSPVADALDFAAKAFPVFQPRTKMTDPYPLMVPPVLPTVAGMPRASTVANSLAAVALVALALLILVAGRRRIDRPIGKRAGMSGRIPLPQSAAAQISGQAMPPAGTQGNK